MKRINSKTFRQWFNANLADYAIDIANHGADCGFPYITYNADCEKIFDKFAEEIYDHATTLAEELGYSNVMEMISKFGRSDLLDSYLGFKVLMVWFMCEEVARELHPEL